MKMFSAALTTMGNMAPKESLPHFFPILVRPIGTEAQAELMAPASSDVAAKNIEVNVCTIVSFYSGTQSVKSKL
jgi:hypothetical protein